MLRVRARPGCRLWHLPFFIEFSSLLHPCVVTRRGLGRLVLTRILYYVVAALWCLLSREIQSLGPPCHTSTRVVDLHARHFVDGALDLTVPILEQLSVILQVVHAAWLTLT